MTPRLAVGCPIWKREWVLPAWLVAVENACYEANVIPDYIFVADPRDEPGQSIIQDFCKTFNRNCWMIWIEEENVPEKRVWNDERFHRMVYLRNLLLGGVRNLGPELFLSLDSDMLLHPHALKSMLELVGDFDAVGGKAYMTEKGSWCPSFGYITANRGILRYESTDVLRVDAIMAIKLMTPLAYLVDYEFHEQGEDIGWSLACKAEDVTLGWDGRVTNKHVMSEKALNAIDQRCGF